MDLLFLLLRKEVKTRTGIDLDLLNPIDFVENITSKIMFITGKQDEFN